MQHVDETVFGREQPGRHAAVGSEDKEGDPVVEKDGAADASEYRMWQVCIRVYYERDANQDMGMVDSSEDLE